MVSTECTEAFERYYQKEYDFNTTALTLNEVSEIKKLVREKRVKYASAPIGEKVFDWILNDNSNIKIELVEFDSEKIDGMLYIPSNGKDKAYIILNTKKSLANQIFAAMHEYYHYIKDYYSIKNNPYICNFSSLENVNEKKASRFAAEFLLPEDALREEVRAYSIEFKNGNESTLSFKDYATLSMYLTVKYQMPLKAVIYRLIEERYSIDVEEIFDNYDFIKAVLQEVKILGNPVQRLYSTENPYLEANSSMYTKMKIAYDAGFVSREEMLSDAKSIGLDLDIVKGMFSDIDEDDADDEDDELISSFAEKWRS